jgi:hypothetical protein
VKATLIGMGGAWHVADGETLAIPKGY